MRALHWRVSLSEERRRAEHQCRCPGGVRTLLLVALVVALGSGCIPDWTASPAGAPQVAAVGDSILRQLEFYGPTHPNTDHALTRSIQDAGWRASVRGENGWRIAWIKQLAAAAAERGADGVIIEGVNDVSWIHFQPRPGWPGPKSGPRSRARSATSTTSRASCGPPSPGPNYYYDRPTVDRRSVGAINGELRRQAMALPEPRGPRVGRPLRHPPGLRRSRRSAPVRSGRAGAAGGAPAGNRGCLAQVAPPATVPATTVPPATVPATTIPTTTVPATTIPPTVPATTIPPTTVPATTFPAT